METDVVNKLINAALAAREKAYAPYSKFRVGAAVLARGGQIHTGCNIENVSYGLTCCAERVAVFKAVSNGDTDIEAVAVAAGTDDFCPPCGACRQVLAEFGGKIKVYLANSTGDYRMLTVDDLLPVSFGPKTMEIV